MSASRGEQGRVGEGVCVSGEEKTPSSRVLDNKGYSKQRARAVVSGRKGGGDGGARNGG